MRFISKASQCANKRKGFTYRRNDVENLYGGPEGSPNEAKSY